MLSAGFAVVAAGAAVVAGAAAVVAAGAVVAAAAAVVAAVAAVVAGAAAVVVLVDEPQAAALPMSVRHRTETRMVRITGNLLRVVGRPLGSLSRWLVRRSVRLNNSKGLSMEKIFGLPAHLLMVHLPVVLIPVVAVAAVLLAVRRQWRGRFGLATAIASLVSVGAVILAKESGEGMFILMKEAPDIKRHQSLANATVILTILLFVAIVTMFLLHRRAGKAKAGPFTIAVSVITIALAVMATVSTIATGHEGAKIASEQIGVGG